MHSNVKPFVFGIGGIALAGILAGWIYASSPGYEIDPGALFDPRNIVGSIVVVISLFLSARVLRPFSPTTWRRIRIIACILYPLCILTSFYTITKVARWNITERYKVNYQNGYRAMYNQDPSPDDTRIASERLERDLDAIFGSDTARQAQTSVNWNVFWGPIWVLIVAGILLKIRGYRLKWKPNLDKYIEKVEPENDQQSI